MLRSCNELIGYDIRATDGNIGSVKDALFDDKAWIVRYLVADTRKWLPGRKVLLIPGSLGRPDSNAREIPVSLTRKQVKDSPDISEDEPVSEQQQVALHEHFTWEPYWVVYPGYAGPVAFPSMAKPDAAEPPASREPSGDPHLRSVKEVGGYGVSAKDGAIGHVEDFLVDDDGWVVRYVVVDTRNWLPGRKVLASPEWFDAVSWFDKKVLVNVDRRRIERSPEYDSSKPLGRDYETRLHEHYGVAGYW